MFGFFRMMRVKKACVTAVRPFLIRPFDPWPPQFWRDPFVIGFLMYVISTVGSLTPGYKKLSAMNRGFALMKTLEEIGAPPSFMDQVNALTALKSPDFMLGGRNAETVVTYIFGLHPMPGDQDVAAATELATATTFTGKVDHAEIGGALMHMLFSEVVRKRVKG